MLTLFAIWVASFIWVVWIVIQQRRGSAGLPLSYFFYLSLVHVPGAWLYLDAEELPYDGRVTEAGFEQTVIGMLAFLVGLTFARYFLVGHRGQQNAPQDFSWLERLAFLYIVVGGACYFVLTKLAGSIPSATAIVAPLGSLIVVGSCLWLWVALEKKERSKFWLLIAALPLIPIATLTLLGFLGFGTTMILTIATFLMAYSKRRLRYLFAAPLIAFLGLSLFVNYMAVREEIRQHVWHQDSSTVQRLEIALKIFDNFAWFDSTDSRQRVALVRLNQNSVLGTAMHRLDSGQVQYGSFDMFPDLIVGLIPRIVWPNKPVVGGGKEIVPYYTGISFAEGTSVGAGQVMEFYVNFGTAGVIVGFLLLGWIVGRIDLRIIHYLQFGDQRNFVFWSLIGLTLLNPQGNLLEIVVSATAATVTGLGVGYLLPERSSSRRVLVTGGR